MTKMHILIVKNIIWAACQSVSDATVFIWYVLALTVIYTYSVLIVYCRLVYLDCILDY